MRRGRPRGLVRTMGRTAVIAGTAQSVSGRVARQQAATHRASAKPEKITDEVVDQLKKLAELRDAGVLTQKEFAAKKAKLLH